MIVSNILQRKARPIRREAATHLFTMGQVVRLRPPHSADIYRITGLLPPRGDAPQYRIRNDGERHERVTTQDSLELVLVSPAGHTLIEGTFGPGQGTETQQSRDQKAEAGEGPAQARTLVPQSDQAHRERPRRKDEN